MTIEITPEVERALAIAARRQGTTPEIVALDALRSLFVPVPAPEPLTDNGPQRSLADALAPHIGILASGEIIPGGAGMSQNISQKFTSGLVDSHDRDCH